MAPYCSMVQRGLLAQNNEIWKDVTAFAGMTKQGSAGMTKAKQGIELRIMNYMNLVILKKDEE